MLYTGFMDFKDIYLNFKPTYKYYYLKNNGILPGSIPTEEIIARLMTDIDLILSVLKISPSKIGYIYWRDAIAISVFSEKDHLRICNDIYPLIAKKYNKTIISIERAMRLCFDNIMYYPNKENDYVLSFMDFYLRNPHNSDLLMKLVELVVSQEFCRYKASIFR